MKSNFNIERLQIVAEGLSQIDNKFVFVGGAVVELYCDDQTRPEARETNDVDVVVEVVGAGQKEKLDDSLRKTGFQPDRDSKIICRHKYRGIIVDVMPSEERFLGFSNKWYKDGIINSVPINLNEASVIQVFKVPYFLASKMEALEKERDGKDFRWNKDFDDIVYIFDNRTTLSEDILRADEEVKSYLKQAINRLLLRPGIDEDIAANLGYYHSTERQERIIKIWQEIAES